MGKPLFEKLRGSFPDNTVLVGYRGSIAHNMYIPNTDPNSIDDVDLMGVFMAPVEHYIGITKTRETVERFVGKYDIVSYEYIKFVKLLLKSNPNVLSLLWVKDNHYIKRHEYGQVLIDNRDLFISKAVYKSFTGYAYAQLKKMADASSVGVPTDLAYLAGIFDGEGHVCIAKSYPKGMRSPFHHLDIGITNTDTDLITSLLDQYGGNIGQTGVRGGHRINCYRWRLSGPKTISFLKLLLPYLTIKKRQAEIAIAFQKTIMGRKRGAPLTDEEVQQRDEFRQALSLSRRDKTIEVPKQMESNLYTAAYMGKKRKELVKKFGFDPKAASHCIRLLKMGVEFLTTGELNVFREDAPMLLEIKTGKWKLEQVKEEAKRLFILADEAYVRSKIPSKPEYNEVESIVKETMYDYITKKSMV